MYILQDIKYVQTLHTLKQYNFIYLKSHYIN